MNWKPYYNEIIQRYDLGESPTDIAITFGCNRTTIKNIIYKNHKLRSKSEAGKLSAIQGKKDKAIKMLIIASKTTNRFNPLKVQPTGENNPNWIKDRSKVKQKRNITEERYFFKEVLSDRLYTCELTKKNGKLSVHHIKGVWSNPELQYEKSNCIVILNEIHKKFHKIYGNRSTESDWNEFILKKEYEIPFSIKKRNYVPFKDITGTKVGRLLVKEKVGLYWRCICDCGNEKFLKSSNLKSTFSCGCYRKEVSRDKLLNNPIWKLSPLSNKLLIV